MVAVDATRFDPRLYISDDFATLPRLSPPDEKIQPRTTDGTVWNLSGLCRDYSPVATSGVGDAVGKVIGCYLDGFPDRARIAKAIYTQSQGSNSGNICVWII